jgi:coenzyme F420-dependent glucose-6-phosphate dehydrogenase
MRFKISYDVGPAGAWFEPVYTLKLTRRVEEAGFDAAWFGDHFLPWFHTHAHSPHAWVWLSAAASNTATVPVGSDITVPMFKYHPLIVAQAFATMERLFPGRVLLGVGTGEAINEAPFVNRWPTWKERGETLAEAVQLMRRYWSEPDYFSFEGKYFNVKNVFCYDKPKKGIPIYWSAFGVKSAKIGGLYADHLMTSGPPENLHDNIFSQFLEAAKSAGRNPEKIEKCVYIDGGYGDLKKLVSKYRLSAGSLIPENFNERDPRKIELSTSQLTDDYILDKTCLFSSPDQFIELIEKYRKAGMNHFLFGDWGYNPLGTVAMFRTKILPYFGIKAKKRKRHI